MKSKGKRLFCLLIYENNQIVSFYNNSVFILCIFGPWSDRKRINLRTKFVQSSSNDLNPIFICKALRSVGMWHSCFTLKWILIILGMYENLSLQQGMNFMNILCLHFQSHVHNSFSIQKARVYGYKYFYFPFKFSQ